MKPSLSPGLTFLHSVRVDEPRSIDFMGEEARVYATPALVRDLEIACRESLLCHLDPGEDSVGARIELDHLAPTPLGMDIEFSITVAQLEGRRVTFDFIARDSVEEVARGRHVRFVVDTEKTRARLRAKAERAAAKA